MNPNLVAMQQLIFGLRREAADYQNMAMAKNALADQLQMLIADNYELAQKVDDQAIDLAFFKAKEIERFGAIKVTEHSGILLPDKKCFYCGKTYSGREVDCSGCAENNRRFGRWKMVNGEMVEY